MLKSNMQKFLLSTALFPLFLWSQQFDPSFLESLPDNIASDLESEFSSSKTEDKVFKAPRVDIEKIDNSIEKIRLKLDQIESEARTSAGITDTKELNRFGEKFFNSISSTFYPINDSNFSNDYILDAGDTLNLLMAGQKGREYSSVIQRDGRVFFQPLGAFQVAGLSLNQASDLIRNYTKTVNPAYEAFVSLTNLRDINILLTGSVNNPGIFTVSGNSNVLSVLNAAGGITSKGSYRNIVVKRNGNEIAKIDLYKALIDGDLRSLKLRNGDSIIVSPKNPEVAVSGGVAMPAIYEVQDNENLKDILRFAGLIVHSGSDHNITIRKNALSDNRIFEYKLDNIDSVKLTHGDNIQVEYFEPINEKLKTIEITGEIKNPGTFTIADGEKLSSLITRAGGYKDSAYIMGATLTREKSKEIERQINERIYKDMISYIGSTANGAVAVDPQTLTMVLNEFKNSKPRGRITAEFDLRKIRNENSLDITLEAGDKIFIPSYPSEVYVLGEVLSPGARLYKSSFTGKDYIDASGGLGRFAEKGKTIVIHPNGDTYLLSDSTSIFARRKLDIYPGTIIYTPREIGRLEGISYAAVIAPIFSSLALSLASLNSID